jgi:DNA-binding transcriptional MocR family regulator
VSEITLRDRISALATEIGGYQRHIADMREALNERPAEMTKALSTAFARIAELEGALARIWDVVQPLSGNRKFMQIAGPARQVLNIIDRTGVKP